MLQASALSCEISDGAVVPKYLDASDRPWLSSLLEEFGRYAGRPRKLWDIRVREPWPFCCPRRKLMATLAVIRAMMKTVVVADVDPKTLRARMFQEGAQARTKEDIQAAWARAAAETGVSIESLKRDLFADLPPERMIEALPDDVRIDELTIRANQALIQSLLARATSVELAMEGHAGKVVRQARARGLISDVVARGGRKAALHLSGPLSLFRRTTLYGRALGSLVPSLAWCSEFELRATCILDGRPLELKIASGAPILPSKPPKPFDSKLEERFSKDFRRAALEWDLVREPEPIRAGDSIIFPDFAIVHRSTGTRWLFEIVGFWTRDYLNRKLELYRSANVENLILAIDVERCCDDGQVPDGARVISFRGRRIDPQSVLAVLRGEGHGGSGSGR